MLGRRPESTSAREVGFEAGIGGKIPPLRCDPAGAAEELDWLVVFAVDRGADAGAKARIHLRKGGGV